MIRTIFPNIAYIPSIRKEILQHQVRKGKRERERENRQSSTAIIENAASNILFAFIIFIWRRRERWIASTGNICLFMRWMCWSRAIMSALHFSFCNIVISVWFILSFQYIRIYSTIIEIFLIFFPNNQKDKNRIHSSPSHRCSVYVYVIQFSVILNSYESWIFFSVISLPSAISVLFQCVSAARVCGTQYFYTKFDRVASISEQ